MQALKKSARLHSLDAFRGITIAGMLLVNTASLSQSIHPWLAHAYWNGCTFADWVFPFFLFIVGVAMAFSLAKYSQDCKPTRALYWRVLRRGVLLFVVGVMLNAFLSDGWGSIQISGVLQRISLAYMATAVIVLNLPRKAQWGVTALLLLGYWVAYIAFPVAEPVYKPDVAAAELGKFGVMSYFGMMSTIAIVLLGYFTGYWLRTEAVKKNLRTSDQSMTMVLFGLSSAVIGLLWSIWLPLNKKLWTSSYAMFTVGLALILLAVCYELIEVRGYRRWSYPAQVLGLNALFIFATSDLVITVLEKIHIGSGSSAPSSYIWLNEHIFWNLSGSATAGFLFALFAVLFWWLVAYCLYWRRWFISL
ncbi:DUF5009 domain-containing protein [Phormidium sp. LEGE 05292]|uniref:acyltransferase family protein n=1 Tax=[Phormidium] sp. LEGE 05292 TaxID=767427 RepID=UPI00187E1EA0|nr:DUF5009 domain-containing protein [Phormidium sp. LEGE 05292]MBE9228703.1 DUF5009 domain-containing protein [Phormidium sp. LEGE 05292]